MIGSLCCLKLGDIIGRVRTIMTGAVITVIGSVLLSSSFTLAQLPVGRLVLGIGFGCITSTVPVWQSESSPAEHRGALVCLEGLFASGGLAISQWVELGFSFTEGSINWRFPWALPILFAAWILICIPFLPDSPRWLVKKGRVEEASRILAILADLPEDSPEVAADIQEMQESLAEMGKGSLLGLFRNKGDRLLNRTFLAMFATFSQQMNGAGVIGFYTTTIFAEYVGLPQLIARILSACVFTWQLVCCLIPFYTVDRLGRRVLMIIGSVGMGATFILLSATIAYAEQSRACAIVAASCVFIYGFFFSIGALGVNYLYGTEVAPLSYRVPIYALSSTTLWASNFLVVEITPIGFANLGYKFFIIFAVLNLCLILPGIYTPHLLERLKLTNSIVVYFFFPETRMQTLESLDLVFSSAKSPFHVVQKAREISRQAWHHNDVTETGKTESSEVSQHEL